MRRVAGEGPAVQAAASAGVARLQSQDAENAAQIRTVGGVRCCADGVARGAWVVRYLGA